MLNDQEFVQESLITNLYYLRTLREYCARIQVSFPLKFEEYRKKSEELAKRCESIGSRLINLSDGYIPESILESGIFTTPYTLEAELLTEKLFDIDINTDLTREELNIKPGSNTPTEEVVLEIENINREIITLANDFVEFATNISTDMKDQELFAFYYKSLNNYMIEEIKVYIYNLERLNQKSGLNPSFVSDLEYWSNSFLYGISTFIRGEIDPVYIDIFNEAYNFSEEFKNIALEYENVVLTPENQKNMTKNSLELARRFKTFLESLMDKLLKKEIYFISAPITKDNALTAVNFFIFNLLRNQEIEKNL
ncbi:MAG: DUF2935 domain-containing protein [Bacilli bacterium]|nr:DUF2935 domain-containing protein [Bacilli bacterium]